MSSDPATTDVSSSGYNIRPISAEKRDQLAQRLTPEERNVLLKHGTEAAFCGGLLDNKEEGTYCCRLCSLPLFRSNAKFESGTGWPSFFQPFDAAHVLSIKDTSYGMVRIETRCARCDSHLGHMFPDGPPPTRLRFCMNSAALEFFPSGQEPKPDSQ